MRSEATARWAALRPPTILVADDDEVVRDAVSLVLAGEGSEPLLARSGEEALSVIARVPDLDGLYIDIHLSGLTDGWEVGEAFYRKWPTKPIAYVSSQRWNRARAMPSGRFLAKPFTLEMLLDVLLPD